jgi:transposase
VVRPKKVFPNSLKGFEQLAAWLRNRQAIDAHICMEATGAYWEALALHLHDIEQRVSVVNPARIKAFAQSELLSTKTDAVDAALIARFCKSQSPEPWLPPPPEIRVLQALMPHYEHLKTTWAQQSVYAQSSGAALVTVSIREVIATLDDQIAQVERQIRRHFDDHHDLKRRRDCSRRSPESARPPRDPFFRKSRTSIAFSPPRQSRRLPDCRHESGARERPFTGARGSARRATLAFAGRFTCRLWSPSASIRLSGLSLSGCLLWESTRLIIGAVMRKLLVLAYGILRSGVPFDANYA